MPSIRMENWRGGRFFFVGAFSLRLVYLAASGSIGVTLLRVVPTAGTTARFFRRAASRPP
jgi:hypothetical protein